MKTMTVCLLLLLAGCSMSNDEIIAETKKCEDAGMDAQQLARVWDYRVQQVQCISKVKP